MAVIFCSVGAQLITGIVGKRDYLNLTDLMAEATATLMVNWDDLIVHHPELRNLDEATRLAVCEVVAEADAHHVRNCAHGRLKAAERLSRSGATTCHAKLQQPRPSVLPLDATAEIRDLNSAEGDRVIEENAEMFGPVNQACQIDAVFCAIGPNDIERPRRTGGADGSHQRFGSPKRGDRVIEVP